jgi:xanthine dehydrogenase molybdopterin-binding subunit B
MFFNLPLMIGDKNIFVLKLLYIPQNACIILKGRLEPYTKIVPKLSWEQVVKRAYVDRVNLSAVGFYK